MTVGTNDVKAQARTFNLRMHTKSHIPSDVAIGSKDVFKPGSLIEIKQEDGSETDYGWMAFEIGACREDIPKDFISIEQALATQLKLRPHGRILVRPATSTDHSISLVELLVKEQYLSQADLWLFASQLEGTCIYVGKLIEYQGMRYVLLLLSVNRIPLNLLIIGQQ